MPSPLATIVINNYNYQQYVGQAIETALQQSYDNVEVLVVDDGSTDDSRKVIDQFDGITKIYKDNIGQLSCFAAGSDHAKGKYIFFLDADDYYAPETITRAVEALESDPDAVMVQMRLNLVDHVGNRIGYYPPAHDDFPTGNIVEEICREGKYTSTVTTGLGFRTDVIAQVVPEGLSHVTQAADGWVINSVPFYGNLVKVDEPIAYYRRHGSNDSARSLHGKFHPPSLLRKIVYAQNEHDCLVRFAKKHGIEVDPELLFRRPGICASRLAALRILGDQYPFKNDNKHDIAKRGRRALKRSQTKLSRRIMWNIWFRMFPWLPQPVGISIFEVRA